MDWKLFRSLLASGLTVFVFLPSAAHAGWIRDGVRAFQGQMRAYRNSQQVHRDPSEPYGRGNRMLPALDRNGFGYINDLGGGTDENGTFRRPIPSDRAYGVQLEDGYYEAPLRFDDQGTRALYGVQGGQIIRQNYQFNPDLR